MNDKTVKATIAGFLHDLGLLSERAGISEEEDRSNLSCDFLSELTDDKDISEAVNNHKKSRLINAGLDKDSLAYIIHTARLISFGTNYRKTVDEIENDAYDNTLPMATVFNILNGRNKTFCYKMVPLTDEINFPVQINKYSVSPDDYKKLLSALKDDLKTIEYNERFLDALSSVLEKHLSFVPATTSLNELRDISLYDHSKITAAISACIYEYLSDHGITDFRQEIFENIESFRKKKAFIMYSGDFSGIQGFIYNVVADGALKSLRSRSFFLEMLQEHIIDEILSACGLSRANLIYNGGGNCYILLPNTQAVEDKINAIGKTVNKWLRTNFGIQIFYAWHMSNCSANDLMNIPAEERPYEEIYREIYRGLSKMKFSSYTAEELMELNRPRQNEGYRECGICGTEANLSRENRCLWCERFVNISSALLNKDLFITVSDKFIADYPYLTFPVESGEVYYYLIDETGSRKMLEEGLAKRIYTKNRLYYGLPYCKRLFMGDYVYSTLVEDLIDEDGMKRLGVMRADVDNLGQAFIEGFVREDNDPVRKHMYNTLSRTAAFSRQMNMFFKYYLNLILENRNLRRCMLGKKTDKPRIVVVYSGGDDLFLVGISENLLEASVCIYDYFKRYVLNTLTLSFGIGIFPLKYPIYKSADETAELEALSKNTGRNRISVFSADEDHIYTNKKFKDKVIRKKLKLLFKYFRTVPGSSKTGNSLLYSLLTLLKNSGDKINIARCAYILAKMAPEGGSKIQKKAYRRFADSMYSWITNENDRKQIITAIYIYLFLTRRRSE